MTAIKSLLLLLLLLAVMAGLGIGGCRAMGIDPHLHEIFLACPIALGVAMLALVPAFVQQGTRTDTAGMFQASFLGSIIHLGLILMIGLILVMLKRVSTPFVLWLLGAYWATLIGLCVVFAKLIRTAPKLVKKEN